MANNSTLKQVWDEVENRLQQDNHIWVNADVEPADYFDYGMRYSTTADDIIETMVFYGDLVINKE